MQRSAQCGPSTALFRERQPEAEVHISRFTFRTSMAARTVEAVSHDLMKKSDKMKVHGAVKQ
jgi:hypothetical protein